MTSIRFAAGCLAALAIVSPASLAQSNAPATVATEPVIVTALRTESDLIATPYAAWSLGSTGDFNRAAARTTPDRLQEVPSVMVQKTGHGQGSPYLRGFTGFRTLMMVDGVRLNNSTFRDGPNQYWNTVDPLSIDRYEAVMGPGSVLYGSDAVGGTVNAIPNRAPAWTGEPVWERRVLYRGSTAERSNVGRVQVDGRPDESVGFTGGVSLKDFGDLEGGRDVGKQDRTGYEEQDYDGRLEFRLAPDANLSVTHQSVRQDDAERTHRTVYGIDWEGLKRGTDKSHAFDQSRDLTWLTLDAGNMAGIADAAKVTVSRQAQGEELHRVRSDDTSDRQGYDVTTWGASLQLESDTTAGTWVYGVDYYRDGVDSFSRRYKADGSLSKTGIQGPVGDNASYDSVGAFVADTISFADERLRVTPGARYTWSRADADRVEDPITKKAMSVDGDWDAVVGSLRLSWSLDDDSRYALFGGVSQGFRAPNLSDLTRLDTARSTEMETPVTGLDPERFVSWEAGIKTRTERVEAQAAYYYTSIRDMIVRAPTGRKIEEFDEVTKKNSGEGYVQGVELSGEYFLDDSWSVRAMAAWMDGEVDAYPTSKPEKETDDLSRLMPPTAEAALRWRTPSGRGWIEAVCRAADDADQLSADDERDTQRIPPGGTPGYAVFSLRSGWRVFGKTDLTAAVENIADEDYRIHGSGVNEPGRNFVVMIDSRF